MLGRSRTPPGLAALTFLCPLYAVLVVAIMVVLLFEPEPNGSWPFVALASLLAADALVFAGAWRWAGAHAFAYRLAGWLVMAAGLWLLVSFWLVAVPIVLGLIPTLWPGANGAARPAYW